MGSDLFLMAASILLVAAGAAGWPSGRFRLVVPLVLSLVVILLSALPVFFVPFSFDAQILRVAFAARDAGADWNHPFLSYLLNRPAALLSHDPVILRLVPFFWFAAEALASGLVAFRLAGRTAAAITVVWMAISVRFSMGMVDLSDWNLAGFFLALMLLRATPAGPFSGGFRYVPVGALLILGGCFSSHMMVVPSVVMLAWELRRSATGRQSLWHAGAAVVAMAVALYFFLDVVSIGRMAPKLGFAVDFVPVVSDMFLVSPPFGLSPLIPALAAGGLVLMPGPGTRSSWLFLAATVILGLFAVLAGMALAAINGGYYFGLMKGPVFVAAAACVAWAARLPASLLSRIGLSKRVSSAVAAAVVLALAAVGTFRIDPIDEVINTSGVEHIGRLVEASGRGERRVLSNDQNSVILMEYHEIVEGRMDIGQILDSRRSNWVTRTVSVFGLDSVDCGLLPASFLFMFRHSGDPMNGCDIFRVADCTELFEDDRAGYCRESGRAFCYYDCRRKD